VPRLGEARARRFLKQLAAEPFVAFIFAEDRVRVYVKGIEVDDLRTIEELVSELAI
jgi:hypothetical protein